MFDYHCNHCAYDFFMEEGYDKETDTIICPMCGTIKFDDSTTYRKKSDVREIKLKELLDTIGEDAQLRIFADCMTIFHGKKSNISEKEWNLSVYPYMNCRVINHCEINRTTMIVI